MTNFDVETEREINVFRIVERYINTQLKWSKGTDDYLKTIVIGNIRALYSHLYREGFIDIDNVQQFFWQEEIAKDAKRKELMGDK